MNFNQPDTPLAFTTERLLVRRQSIDDLSDLFTAVRDSKKELAPFLPWCHDNYRMTDSLAYIESVKPAWENDAGWSFGIRKKHSNDYIGGCGISKIDEHPIGNLG